MKIDFVVGRMKAGGAERVVSVLANYFADKGHVVRIITFIDADDYNLHPSIERIRFHKKFIINYAIFRGLFTLIYFYFRKKNRPDVICSHINLMGYATIPTSILYNIKLTVSEHSSPVNEKHTIFLQFLWGFLYRFPDAVSVLTKLDLPFFEKKTKRVLVMENPCSFEINGKPKMDREKSILAIGNLNRYEGKGFDNLISIASKILNDNPDWKLQIVGGGDEGLIFLQNETKKYGIEDKVIFTGFRNDIKELMIASEIYILSSRHEGLPMVLIEAMSQGMACISYDCISGPSDIITNNVDGILVSDQNKEEMTAKLNELVINSELREHLRANATKSLEKFSIETVGGKWEALFNSF